MTVLRDATKDVEDYEREVGDICEFMRQMARDLPESGVIGIAIIHVRGDGSLSTYHRVSTNGSNFDLIAGIEIAKHKMLDDAMGRGRKVP